MHLRNYWRSMRHGDSWVRFVLVRASTYLAHTGSSSSTLASIQLQIAIKPMFSRMDAMTNQFSLLALGRQSAARVPLCIRNGICALGCWDTATAFDLLKTDSFEVLVCDLQLAEMDAIGFVQAVRGISPGSEVVFSIDPKDLRHTLLATIACAPGYVL